MKYVLSFFSLFAFGLLIAGVLTVVLSSPSMRLPFSASGEGFLPAGGSLDHTSLLIGMAAGWALAMVGRVPWLELPQRAISWLLANERNIFRFGMAGMFLAVVLYY